MTGPKSIQNVMRTYLSKLAKRAPTATQNSHKVAIRPFVDFCQNQQLSVDDVAATHVQTFVVSRLSTETEDTVTGKIASLANFLAYISDRDPHLIQTEIYYSEDGLVHRDRRVIDPARAVTPYLGPDDPRARSVEALVDYLRQRRYGTRTHTIVELLLATAGAPSAVRQLSAEDISDDHSLVTLQIPQTHAVSAYGLLNERTVPLTDAAVEALNSYFAHERESVDTRADEPVFTTYSGQVAPSTVRVAVKQASQAAVDSPVMQTGISETTDTKSGENDPVPPVTPTDIWGYSLKQHVR